MQKIWIATLTLLTLTQCTPKVYSLQDLPKQYMEIGSFGGFAGTSKTFYLFPNGQRLLNEGIAGTEGITQELTKADKKEFKSLLKELKKMDFQSLDLNTTGNMNYFIKLKTKKTEKRVQWDNMDTAPANLVEFYRTTLKNIKTDIIN